MNIKLIVIKLQYNSLIILFNLSCLRMASARPWMSYDLTGQYRD